MAKDGLMWECSCGYTEFNETEPEDCTKCGNLKSFMQMPAEIVEERARDLAEEFKEESLSIGKPLKSVKSKKSKSISKARRKK